VRRVLVGLAGAAVAVVALAALVVALSARDEAGVSAPAREPGEAQPDRGARHLPAGEHVPLEGLTDPPTSGAHHPRLPARDRDRLDPNEILHALELGNVILFYDSARPPAALVALQEELTGSFDPDLAAAGQAVILARRPGSSAVTAAAWRRLLRAGRADDAAVREFAEHWLGRGAPR
jgi:Protein of unknown function (DUF3105)